MPFVEDEDGAKDVSTDAVEVISKERKAGPVRADSSCKWVAVKELTFGYHNVHIVNNLDSLSWYISNPVTVAPGPTGSRCTCILPIGQNYHPESISNWNKPESTVQCTRCQNKR